MSCCKLDFIIQEKYQVDFSLEQQIKVINGDHYDGEYIVTPKAWEETLLETKNKVLTDNVRVLEVPYDEISNSTGTTVVIAS